MFAAKDIISPIINENEKSYHEKLQELTGSIKDDSFIESNDFFLENKILNPELN